jgi:hypothetical protein
MNPVFIFIPVAIAIVLFFIFKPSKKEKPSVNVFPDSSEPPMVLESTSSFVESVSIEADRFVEANPQPNQVLEVAPAPEVLFEKLPEAAPVEAPMEVQAEAPKPKTAAKPKAKKTAVKKKPAAKK